tara:strand:- start:1193 stop:2263 length:1071 start_codon:yes stop_codon:yes gene_type:complete
MAEEKIDKREASRQSLISAAAAAEGAQTKAQAKGMETGVGTFLKRKKEYEEKKKEFQDSMEDALEVGENEEQDFKDKIDPEVVALREEYILADTPADQNNIMNDTKKRVEGELSVVDAKSELAELALDEMEFDGDDFIFDQIKEFTDGTGTYEVNHDGKVDLIFSDGSKIPLNQFKKEIKAKTIDRDSQKSITALVDNVTELAETSGGEFDYAKHQNKINQIINNSDASLHSLASHKLINGNSFKDHMTEALSKGTYEDLGLSTAKAEELDPTKESPITPEDAIKITQALIQDSDMLKEYLVKYYTDVLQLQYNVNLPKARINTSKNTVTAENTNINTDNQKKGPLNIYDPNTTTL